VTGELSNDMGPMRRFMQTFVLARQSPKMFYVHNDIFRYQDEVFHDLVDGSCTDVVENHASPGRQAWQWLLLLILPVNVAAVIGLAVES